MAWLLAKHLPDKINQAVFVGQMVCRPRPVPDDGTAIHTPSGDIAHQLGSKAGYATSFEADDRRHESRAKLRKLFKTFGPAVIADRQWVALRPPAPRPPRMHPDWPVAT